MIGLRIPLFFLMATVVCHVPEAGAQSLSPQAREHAARHPNVPIEMVGSLGHYSPKTLEELGTEADGVFVARLTRIGSYLDAKSTGVSTVSTEYAILPVEVVAGRLPTLTTSTPRAGSPLILSVYGGEVIVEGVLIREWDPNHERINDGGQYLLFLKWFPKQERFGIYHGGIFEITRERVRPLLKEADRVFRDTLNGGPGELIARVRAAAQAR